MQFRLNRGVEVPLRDQLVTQIILAIASGELKPGEQLPSTRALARRYRIHQNTVSGAYQQLVRDGWAESRHGSGVYISEIQPSGDASRLPLVDQLIADLVRKARALGVPVALLQERWQRWLSSSTPTRLLVVEPDPNLRCILVKELSAVLTMQMVESCSPAELDTVGGLTNALILGMPSRIKPAGVHGPEN